MVFMERVISPPLITTCSPGEKDPLVSVNTWTDPFEDLSSVVYPVAPLLNPLTWDPIGQSASVVFEPNSSLV